MGFDISKIGKITRTFDAVLDGTQLVFHYRKPTTEELIGLHIRQERYFASLGWKDKDASEVEAVESYGPIAFFIHEHITGVEGLESAGEAVGWDSLTKDKQKGLIMDLGPKQAGRFLIEMREQDSLTEDEKNS